MIIIPVISGRIANYNMYVDFKKFNIALTWLNSVFALIICSVGVYIAVFYVRKLPEKGFLMYLLILSIVAEALFLANNFVMGMSYTNVEANIKEVKGVPINITPEQKS